MLQASTLLDAAWRPHGGDGTIEALAARDSAHGGVLSLHALERTDGGAAALRWLLKHE